MFHSHKRKPRTPIIEQPLLQEHRQGTMISNRNMSNYHQPTKQQAKNKSYTSVARSLISRLPLKETKQRQERDPEGPSKPQPMDVSPRESRESERPFLVAKSKYESNIPVSVEKLCYKLDLGLEMPERLPRIDYSHRISSSNMAIQTAQIFRGIKVSEDGTVLTENSRASKSNAGKKPRKGKRSRQAANIHKARDLADEAYEGNMNGDTTDASKMLSLVVIGGYCDMNDLVRCAPRKLRKLDTEPEAAPIRNEPVTEPVAEPTMEPATEAAPTEPHLPKEATMEVVPSTSNTPMPLFELPPIV